MSNFTTSWTTFHIPALDCPEELGVIESGLRPLQGIRQLRPDYLQHSLAVEYETSQLNSLAIRNQLDRIGFPASDAGHDEPAVSDLQDSSLASPLRSDLLAAALLFAVACGAHLFRASTVLVAASAIASTLLAGWPVMLRARRAFGLWRLDMNALMSCAAIGGILTAQWLESAAAMCLFRVALYLEERSRRNVAAAIQSLVQRTPAVAHRIDAASHQTTDVSTEALEVDDVILVKPGETIVTDGVVVAGESAVNQAAVTGENQPVERRVGDFVFGGSLNGEGSLRLRVIQTANNSTVARISRLIQQAASSRSPTERIVDRFARSYTPMVLGLAAMLAVVPPVLAATWPELVFSGEPDLLTLAADWLHRALVLLVIACPCALVISTPVTITCGLHRAARSGILIKGGAFLEQFGKLRCIAIDKTGTLTEGRPRLVWIRPQPGYTEDEVARTAAALEHDSEHPLARAIVVWAEDRGLDVPRAKQFETLRGFGVRAAIDGVPHVVASPRYFHDMPTVATALSELPAGDSTSLVVVVRERKLLGVIGLADQPRAEARQAVAAWRQLGVRRIAMLTGDQREAAEAVADQVGITEVHAELLPEDKIALMRQIGCNEPTSAMIGDGVNDAPALAAAAVGVALGSDASDTAIETADVAILLPDLSRVDLLMRLSRKTRAILWQNLWWAVSIKLGVLGLAACGRATMWMAVAADVGASLLVTTNGMRLLSRSIPIGYPGRHECESCHRA